MPDPRLEPPRGERRYLSPEQERILKTRRMLNRFQKIFSRRTPWPPIVRADGLTPATDAAHNWDWMSDTWWANLAASAPTRQIPNPFDANGHAGVDLGELNCMPADGWELYTRRILTTDGVVDPAAVEETVAGDLHFALYNVYSAVLRVFTLFQDAAFASDKWIVRYFCSEGTEDYLNSHSLFNHMQALGLSATDSSLIDVNEAIFSVPAPSNRWIVNDLPLAFSYGISNVGTGFPGDAPGRAVYLNTQVITQNTQNVKLNGHLKIKVPLPQSNKSSVFGLLTSIGTSVLSVGSSAKDVQKAGETLQGWGTTMNNQGGSGDLLLTAGTALASGSGPVGAAIAATQIIRSLMSFSSKSGGSNVATYEGSISLDGTIETDDVGAPHKICICEPKEGGLYPTNIPYIFKKYPGLRLGLFSLWYVPTFKLRLQKGAVTMGSGTYDYRVDLSLEDGFEGFKDALIVNPDAAEYFGMIVQITGWQFVLRRPKFNSNEKIPSNIAVEKDPMNKDWVNVFPKEFISPGNHGPMRVVTAGNHFPAAFDTPMGQPHQTRPFEENPLLRVRYQIQNRVDASRRLMLGMTDVVEPWTVVVAYRQRRDLHWDISADASFNPF